MDGNEKKKGPLEHIEDLEEDLYSRDADKDIFKVTQEDDFKLFNEKDVPTEWTTRDDEPKKNIVKYKKLEKHVSSSKKILIGSIALFVVACGFAALVFFAGSNSISTNNVEVSIAGPASVGAGEVLSFDVIIQNQNNVDLQGTSLLVEYPKGAVTANDAKTPLVRQSESVEDVKSGTTIKRHMQVILFGEANSIQSITASIEYRVKDSSATYFKEHKFDIAISNAPVRMIVSTMKEVISGKELGFTVNIDSNSPSVVRGLMLKVDYPQGYIFESSLPNSTFGNNYFVIGDLSPGEHRAIKITGVVQGKDNEQTNFHFTLGVQSTDNQKNISVVYLSDDELVTIQKPFVSADLAFDGSGDDPYAATAGQPIAATINWTNNLPTRITDLEIQAKVGGDALNRLSISAHAGFYRSLDNIILWNKYYSNDYALVEPGQSGIAQFNFASFPASSLMASGQGGHVLTVDISINAKRFSDANVPEDIVSTVTKTIKINSDVTLDSRSLYFTGPFQNQGPIPPKVEQNTTYTIVWTVTNTLNDVTDAQVTAVLPGYMVWLNKVNPDDGSVTFDASSRQVTWNIGDINAGTGFQGSPKEVDFQVALVPSLSQRGQAPILIGPAGLVATDRFTGATLKDSSPYLTTNIADYFMQSGDTSTVQQ